MERLQEIWSKSKSETIKIILSTILFLGFMWIPPFVGESKYFWITFAGTIGFIIPYFIKGPVVDYEYFPPILKYLGFALYVGVFSFKEEISKANIFSQSLTMALFTFYVSFCFWVFSDKRVGLVKKEQNDRIRY